MTLDTQVEIKSQNEDDIRELVKEVQDKARNELNQVYEEFTGSLRVQSSQ